jgi:hypothetical protein
MNTIVPKKQKKKLAGSTNICFILFEVGLRKLTWFKLMKLYFIQKMQWTLKQLQNCFVKHCLILDFKFENKYWKK